MQIQDTLDIHDLCFEVTGYKKSVSICHIFPFFILNLLKRFFASSNCNRAFDSCRIIITILNINVEAAKLLRNKQEIIQSTV